MVVLTRLVEVVWALRLGEAEALCAYVCDNSEYTPCTLPSGAKQELTYYFLLRYGMNDTYQRTYSNHQEKWVWDDTLYMCFVAYDFMHLQVYHTLYRNYHTPLIPVGPEDLIGLAGMTQPFDDTLRNPVWSGYEWTYGPAAVDDGPAPFAVAKFETCYPPDKITLRIAGRQNMEEIGQGLGNAYEEQDVKDAGYSGWDDPAIKYYEHPPVVFWDVPVYAMDLMLHTDEPQPYIFRLNAFPYTESQYSGDKTSFVVAWDGRQWPWTLGPQVDQIDPLERQGRSYYPPGRYTLAIDLEIENTNVSLNAGYIDLVYGGSLMDGSLQSGMIDRLRQIRGQYDNVYIHSPLYASHEQGGADGFSFKTLQASSLYSPVFHYDGHGPLTFTKIGAPEPPCLADLVYIDACNGIDALDWYNSSTRVLMGWEGSIASPYSYVWDGYFYEGLFNLVNGQGQHYTIQEAHDYASTTTDLYLQIGYVQMRVPLWSPRLIPLVTGGADRSVNDFERTSW